MKYTIKQLLDLYLKGLNLREIKNMTGISISGIYYHIHNIKKYKIARINKTHSFCVVCDKKYKKVKSLYYRRNNCCSRVCQIEFHQMMLRRRLYIKKNLKEKNCSRCKEILPISNFYWNRSENIWFPRCKKCFRLFTYAWIKRNPERWREITRKAVRKYQLTHSANVR